MLGCVNQVMIALNQDRYDILYGGSPTDQASALIFSARRSAHAKDICERAWEAGRAQRLRLWRPIGPSSGHSHRNHPVQPRPRSGSRSRSPPRHVGEAESSNSSHADVDLNGPQDPDYFDPSSGTMRMMVKCEAVLNWVAKPHSQVQLHLAAEGSKIQYLTYVGGVKVPAQIVHGPIYLMNPGRWSATSQRLQ